MHPDIERILFTEDEIKARVREMGEALTQRYADAEPGEVVLIGVLRGAAMFMMDLARSTDIPLMLDFMAVSSYGNGVVTSGRVRIVKDVDFDLTGKRIVIAEDVVDSGLTLAYLMEIFKTRGAKSVEVLALFYKDVPREHEIKCADIGFICPPDFVVGYGLDYAELYRNLPYLGVLKPSVYSDAE